MTLEKNTPASEAGAEDNNKAKSTENYIGTAQKFLQAFSKDAQYFCGFTDKKLPIGKGLKPNQTKYGIKLSELNPAELWTAEELNALKVLPFDYLGLPLSRGEGFNVVCLDFDGKNASDSSRFDSYRKFAEKQGYLVETSLSGKGFHVFFKTDSEMPLKKWTFPDGVELEFFPHQSAKAILLTGKELKGELKYVENPLLELKQQGLHEPTQISKVSTLKPRLAVFSADDVDRLALQPENMNKWVPMLFPRASFTSDGRWRVKSSDLGRDLEEDLSITENGIKDFGLHDLPDEFNEGKFTPTQLVAEWKFGGDKYWRDSRDWLREVCGLPQFKGRKSGLNEADQPNPWLDREITLDEDFIAPRTVIQGFLGDGIQNLIGQGGIGKTNALVTLALIVAGIKDAKCELETTVRRKIIYVSEDTNQIKQIICGFLRHSTKEGGSKFSLAELSERFVLVEALRSDPETLKKLSALILKYKTFEPDEFGELIEVLPLVVLDTKSAIFAMEDENSNSETSKYIATVKENFCSLDAPVWIISHMAKENFGRQDLERMSARGATAGTDDVNGTGYFFSDPDFPNSRFFGLGKKRFEPDFTELEIQSEVFVENRLNYVGRSVPVKYRYSTIRKSDKGAREEKAQQAKAESEQQKDKALKVQILNLVASTNARDGEWINKERLKVSINSSRAVITKAIDDLLASGELAEVKIPDHFKKTRQQSKMLVLGTAQNDLEGF